MHGVIDHPAAWRGPDIVKSTRWVHHFSKDEIAELEAALSGVLAKGLDFGDITRENFPLPNVGKRFEQARLELEDGLGLFLFRGMPAERYSREDLRKLYWGMGRHLGTAVSQSKNGDVLADVRDFGEDIHKMRGRAYKSKQHLPFHTDSADVTGLFALRTAKEGGLSMLASSLAIHNEIARTRPDLLEVLYQPYYWPREGHELAPNQPTFYAQPIYSVEQGHFACRCIIVSVQKAQRMEGVPRISAAQEEAINLIEQIACREDFHFSMMFQPGDLQLINNHVVFHARTNFEDHPEEDRRRHLLRMWLSMPNSRPLNEGMGGIYLDRRAGAVRGGYPSRTGSFIYHTRGNALD